MVKMVTLVQMVILVGVVLLDKEVVRVILVHKESRGQLDLKENVVKMVSMEKQEEMVLMVQLVQGVK